MKFALCQINPIVGNFSYNQNKILNNYRRCIELKADIIVYPELVICGYPPQDLLWEEGFIQNNLDSLSYLACHSKIPMILGYIRNDGKNLYNSAAICYNGKVQASCDKVLLPTYDVFDEARYFTKGHSPNVISIPIDGNILKIGIQICEDLWDHEYECKVTKTQMEMGANLILNISASPYHINRFFNRKEVILEKVRETGLPFIYCNMVGAQDELIFDGQSMAYSKNENLIGYGKAFQEEIVMVDFNSKSNIKINIQPKEEKLYRALCLGVKDYFKKTHHSEAVLGLSGGIDSALVASIATDALGREKVHGISLPSKYSSDHSLSDAKQLAENLGIDYQRIPIQTSVDELESGLYPHFRSTDPNVAGENIQARVRGNLLMTIANNFGWLVLSTGNKTELALGYCTLYGDMSGGLAVISDLSKSDVYALAGWLNSIYENRIPENIIQKAPSAELAYNQVDPFDYDLVSPLVDAIIEKRNSPDQLIESGNDEALVNSIYNRIMMNEYKRRQAAPGLRVTSKAFGVGRRFPIVNHFKVK